MGFNSEFKELNTKEGWETVLEVTRREPPVA